MSWQDIVKTEEYKSVVTDYRATCLWFAGDVLHPETDVQLEQVLDAIETNGDMAAFKRVGRIRRWLSPDFRPKYSSGLPVRA